MSNLAPASAATLTSQERVNRMFQRRDHDRVPRHESFWGDTIKRWQGEGLFGGTGEVLDFLQSDFCSLQWLWPQCFPEQNQRLSENEETYVVRDGQGKTVRYWRHRQGTPEHLGFDCDSREKWEKIYKPALLDSGLQNDPEAVKRKYRRARSEGKWTHLTAVESFEETRSLMGDEITLMAMAEDPEWIRDVSRTFTDVELRNLDALMAAGIQPDGLWIYGDMAFNHATMCSPAMYRELIWPDHKRLADWAHAHRMWFIYHTDGDVRGVMDLYLAAGFDCLQPLEAKANMDIRQLCPKFGKQLAFFGNCDVMVYATNDKELIETEIAGKLAAGKATRGYAYHSDHSVPPQVSWDTYRFIKECVDRHGNYD
ncbi:MAG: uroporphyrinogen decarboxylase family protein [Phycisphaeraceae bacterium]